MPLGLRRENIEVVIEGLSRVVRNGTGQRAQVEGIEICGKTGTAQVISKKNPLYEKVKDRKNFRPHSWFVSFAPRINPRYAMVILIENGGDGSGSAASLASRIYRRLFHREFL
jgi:cell division protein FtsI/penicillin-binding protein 2